MAAVGVMLQLPNAISTALQALVGRDAGATQAIFNDFTRTSFPFGPVTADMFTDKFTQTMAAASDGLPESSYSIVFAYKDLIGKMTAVVNSSSEERHTGNTPKIVATLAKHIANMTKDSDKQRLEQAKTHKWTVTKMTDKEDTRANLHERDGGEQCPQ
jgi:hypothetical protein